MTATFQQVARKHFDTTLRKQNQPHTITLHLDFLRRTQVGLATFKVKDVKLGRQTSIVHVTLSQDGREEVVGYITNSNILKEEGVSYPTAWSLTPAPLPADVSKFESNSDVNWAERKQWPFADFRKATQQIRSWFPRKGQPKQSITDEWLCLRNGENWTNESIGDVVDTFPQVIESYLMDEDPYSIEMEQRFSAKEQEQYMKGNPGFWYPTLLLNLDVKKALPEEGVKWLFVRLQTKQIKNGRFDLEIVVLDEGGDLVALSHHVCLAVSSARNLAARRKAEAGESKL